MAPVHPRGVSELPQPGFAYLAAGASPALLFCGLVSIGFVNGISDISAPIMRGDRAAAALTVPFIHHGNLQKTMDEATGHLVETARQISELLSTADSRV